MLEYPHIGSPTDSSEATSSSSNLSEITANGAEHSPALSMVSLIDDPEALIPTRSPSPQLFIDNWQNAVNLDDVRMIQDGNLYPEMLETPTADSIALALAAHRSIDNEVLDHQYQDIAAAMEEAGNVVSDRVEEMLEPLVFIPVSQNAIQLEIVDTGENFGQENIFTVRTAENMVEVLPVGPVQGGHPPDTQPDSTSQQAPEQVQVQIEAPSADIVAGPATIHVSSTLTPRAVPKLWSILEGGIAPERLITVAMMTQAKKPSTLLNYSVPVRRFKSYANMRQVSPFTLTRGLITDFLNYLVLQGHSYSVMRPVRGALTFYGKCLGYPRGEFWNAETDDQFDGKNLFL